VSVLAAVAGCAIAFQGAPFPPVVFPSLAVVLPSAQRTRSPLVVWAVVLLGVWSLPFCVLVRAPFWPGWPVGSCGVVLRPGASPPPCVVVPRLAAQPLPCAVAPRPDASAPHPPPDAAPEPRSFLP